jgi:putative transposase
MKGSRFSEEQIIGILGEQEAAAKTADVCRCHRISDATFYKWKTNYDGLEISEARRLTGPEDENPRLKKLLAESLRPRCLDRAIVFGNVCVRCIL